MLNYKILKLSGLRICPSQIAALPVEVVSMFRLRHLTPPVSRVGCTLGRRPAATPLRFLQTRARANEDENTKSRGSFMTLLVLMPIISFGLGCWQVKRLRWKHELIANAESRLALPPLPLPPNLNVDVISEFDYRRVTATGEFDHSQEMLVGPRLNEGRNGFLVVTPLIRKDGSKLLVCRGWIEQSFEHQASRPDSLVKGPVTVQCLIRATPKGNMFTPDSKPEIGRYYFMDIPEMARRTGSQAVYLQELEDMQSELLPEQKAMRGIPLGAPPKVEFRNTHFQYILTWYGLSIITAAMLVMVLRQRRAATFADARRAKLAHAKKWQ